MPLSGHFCLYLQPYKKERMVLMVRLFWVFFFLGFGLAVSAQDDPVLMRINGKEVLVLNSNVAIIRAVPLSVQAGRHWMHM